MTVILRSVKEFVRYYCAESSSNQNPENNLVCKRQPEPVWETLQKSPRARNHRPQSTMMLANQGNFPAIVKLNVGGQHFTTSLQTLARDPTSMLAAMFSGRHEVQTTEDGSFFIDRDSTYFRFILNYLRDGELILPEGATFLAELEAEARFYQVQGILNELRTIKASNVFEESVILRNEEHRRVLKDCLPLVGEWRLLFRASRDGFAASVFHSKCDHKGATITVVKSGGSIFGGFTENPWKSKIVN